VLAVLCATVTVALALPVVASAHSSLVQAGPVSLASPAAVIGGSPWPGRRVARITYFNATSNKWPVAQAVKAWNTSGVRVRFVPVPRRRAQVVITHSPGPRSDSFVSGFASIGYVYPGGGYVTLSRLEHPRLPHFGMAGVATHELGHVLGLEHEDRRCATMNTSLWSACANDRPCRLLERDDIRGAIKLYGGRGRMSQPGFCPNPPSRIRSTGNPDAYGVTLEWRNPRSPLFDRVQVARGKDKCPDRPERGGGWQPGGRPGARGRLVDRDLSSGERLATGRYCYAFWSLGDPNVVSRRRTLWVDFDPQRPAAPANLSAVLGTAGSVSVTWSVAPHPEFEAVEGSATRGRCAADPDDGEYPFRGDGTTSSVQLESAGRYCFAAWTRDSIGALTGPVTVWVDHKGTAPEAAFEYTQSASLTASFFDQSSDADGDEIVRRRWEFGDGTVNDGNDPYPTHSYGGPGTYTARLTVADANGLVGTTTRDVVVDAYEDCCY
jgi:hypothetical protein